MWRREFEWIARQAIPPTQKLVLFCLLGHSGPDYESYPSVGGLAKVSGLGRSTVQRALTSLSREKGLISIKHRPKTGARHDHSEYRLHVDRDGSPGFRASRSGALPPPQSGAGAPQSGAGAPQSGALPPPQSGAQTSNTLNKPLNKPENNLSGATPERESGFEEFWAAFPRKVAQDAARRAWANAIKRATPEEIMAGLRRFQFPADRQYAPYPAAWLNGGRWKDGSDAAPAPAGPVRPVETRSWADFMREAAELGI